jgi:hypothetical protein
MYRARDGARWIAFVFVCLAVEPKAVPSASLPRDNWGELIVSGRADQFSVSPSGRLWLVTMMGNSYLSDSVDGDWQLGPLQNPHPDEILANDDLVDVSFFDDSLAIMTGYIAPGTGGGIGHNGYYFTKNGGRDWRKLHFNGDEWIYDVFTNSHHQGWMGGSAGSFFYSSDAGRTWVPRQPPFDRKMRTAVILMLDSLHGLVAGLGNGLRETRDNGASWSPVATPLDQGLYKPVDPNPDERILELAPLGKYYLVDQNGRLFFTLRDSIHWTPFPDTTLRMFGYDPQSRTVCGVTADNHVVLVDADLRLVPLSPNPLYALPLDLACRSSSALVMDNNHGFYQVDQQGIRFSYPLSSQETRRPIGSLEQRGDTLIGASNFHVYQSTDRGGTWRRVAVTHAPVSGMRLLPSGELMIWDGHGSVQYLDRATGRLHAAPGLEQLDVIQVLQRPGFLVAYGGMHYESGRRITVSRTFFSGEFAGTTDYGFVATSRDAGTSWQVVDRWDSGGVAGVFVSPGGERMVLQSYLGSVRVLTWHLDHYKATTILQAVEANSDSVPYVQETRAVWFPDSLHGYIAGWTHWRGNQSFETRDGGMTWRLLENQEFPYSGGQPLDSRFVACNAERVDLLQGDTRRTLLTLADSAFHLTGEIVNVGTTAAGTLAVGVFDWNRRTDSPEWVVVDPADRQAWRVRTSE